MTPEQYWAEIHDMGLTPTKVPTVFRTRDGETQRVPDPTPQTAAQRSETIERIRFVVLGIAPVREPSQGRAPLPS
jgi:hypothetical protein